MCINLITWESPLNNLFFLSSHLNFSIQQYYLCVGQCNPKKTHAPTHPHLNKHWLLCHKCAVKHVCSYLKGSRTGSQAFIGSTALDLHQEKVDLCCLGRRGWQKGGRQFSEVGSGFKVGSTSLDDLGWILSPFLGPTSVTWLLGFVLIKPQVQIWVAP